MHFLKTLIEILLLTGILCVIQIKFNAEIKKITQIHKFYLFAAFK